MKPIHHNTDSPVSDHIRPMGVSAPTACNPSPDHYTPGLGDATCAYCLGGVGGGMVAVRRRLIRPPGINAAVSVIEAVAHAECALESSRDGWVIELEGRG